jgi:hypothetical protein
VAKEDLGGADVHTRNGVVDNVAEDEADAFRQIRAFLSYLPSNVWEGPPVRECSDPRDRAEPKLIAIVPRESRRAYKMRRIVEAVVDVGTFFELTPGYGRTQITGLARVAGHPVGVLANDPYVYGGSMTADGAQKLRRFVELCDTFHLPIVSLMDEPGFMIGTEAEKAGTIRYGMEAMFAVNQSAVPWFTVVGAQELRRRRGPAPGPRGTVVAWPSAQSGSMPLESGIELAHGREIAEAADPDARRRELEAEYARAQSMFPRAEAFGVHDLIDPRETRAVLCDWIDQIQPALALQRGPRAYSPRPSLAPPVVRLALLRARGLELGVVVRRLREHLGHGLLLDRRLHGGFASRASVRRNILTVNAGSFAISCAIARQVSSSSASGTTRDTTPWRSASCASSTRPVSARSAASPWPAIWNSRAVPPESGTTPCRISGSRMRALSPAIRRSHKSARSNEPPITQPFSATTIGAGIVKNICVPAWPRSMKSRLPMSSVRTPSWVVSRPDENDLPLPRQTIARTSSRRCSSASACQSCASIASFAALCLSGRLLLRIATDPSYSSVMKPSAISAS